MSYESNDKMVSHPEHYKSGKFEVIDIIDEFTKDLTGTEAVCTANAIKYILRWKKKNGKQDIHKAVWYLMHLIDHMNAEELEQHAKFDEALYQERYNEEGVKESNADTEVELIRRVKEIRDCSTCKYSNAPAEIEPCEDCNFLNGLKYWEAED